MKIPKNTTKHLFFLLLFSCILINANAQNKDKKYPSLLWEISGNGIKSNSYLYGTMHVSNKIAFHLGDSFFMAINSVDKVALESDPSLWMKEIFDTSYIKEFGSQYLVRPYLRNFYKSAFEIEQKESKLLGNVISHNNYLMNGMLYRNSKSNTEHEENTYLDMYIFQAGKKLGKSVLGLEDFMESQRLVEKANTPVKDKNLLKKYKKQYQKLVKGGKRPGDMLEDAYRRGDLDMLDSVQRMMNPSKYHQQYMLHERNQIMADNIDSIIKAGSSLFSGVGSAHLAGEKGMIEMLREKGYTLRPVTRIIGDYSRNFRDKLEKTYIDINFTKQKSSDGVFEIDLPGHLFEIPENYDMKFYFCPEMINGTQFNISRVRMFNSMNHESKDYIMKRIDSLLYENIPGKILEKERITQNGFPAFSIKNKSRKGDYQRYLIVVTDLEIIIFKVAGTLEYLKDKNYLDKIFNSIKINSQESKWKTYEPEYGSFKVDLPGTILQEDHNPQIQNLVSSRKSIQSFDSKNDEYYYLGRIGLHEYLYIEEDTFELSYLAEKFTKDKKYKELRREFGNHQGYPTLQLSFKDSSKYLHLKYLIQGPRYFLLLAQTNDSIAPEKFYNSFEIKNLQYTKKFYEYEDTNLYYTVNTIVDPVKKPKYNNYYYGNNNDDEDDSHREKTEKTRYINNTTDEEIQVKFIKFHRFYSRPSMDSFWKSQTIYYTEETLFAKNRTISADSLEMELQLTDTNSTRMIDVKMILKEGVLYKMSSLTDTITGRSQFVDEFYKSFKPSTDTTFGIPVTINKADLFFEHLFGEDSTKREQAYSSKRKIDFEPRHFDQAVRMFETFEHDDFEMSDRARLLTTIGKLKTDKAIPYLKNVYEHSLDTPLFQISVLKALTWREEKEAISTFKDLLESETPLGENNSIYYMMTHLHDSLELNKTLFPMLFEFTRYPEYKGVIYSILSSMLDSNIISHKTYKKYKKTILRDAKDELKREASRSTDNNSSSSTSISYEYGNYDIDNFNKLLLPFCSDPDVQEYFKRIKRVNNMGLNMDKNLIFLENDEEVNDTIWNYYASFDNYRKPLYNRLKYLKRLDLFPKEYLNQKDMVLATKFAYETINLNDSTKYLFKKKAYFEGKPGYIYFFKSKDKYNDDEWNLSYYGIQPLDTSDFNLKSDFSSSGIDLDFEDQEEVDKKVEEIIEKIKYKHRKRVVAESNRRYLY